MLPQSQHSQLYSRFQSRWRHSINQFTKLQEQSKLTKLDTVLKKTCRLKLKMKNRLGQIDEEFLPVTNDPKSTHNPCQNNQNCQIGSTKHDTNIFTCDSQGTQLNLEQSLIFYNNQYNSDPNPEQQDQKLIYKCHQIREEIVEELTEYNQSRYANEMQKYCSKYNDSLKSVLYSIIGHDKKQIYEFCYNCDGRIVKNNSKTEQSHSCQNRLTSISAVQQALLRLRCQVFSQNNKIFDVFLHNALQSQTNIQELITNVTVLKQSIELEYEPQQAVLRLRLMNLIGKKIGLLMEEKQLDSRLHSLCKSTQSKG